MKISLLHKCIISFIGIILITSIIQNLLKKNEKIQEGLNKPSDDQIGKIMKDEIMKILYKIGDDIKKGLAPLIDFGNLLAHTFEYTLPEIGKSLKYAFDDIGNGIKLEFKNLGIGLKNGFEDIVEYIKLFKYVFSYIDDVFKKYIGSRINCGIQKIGKLRSCFIFYFMCLIFKSFYRKFRHIFQFT